MLQPIDVANLSLMLYIWTLIDTKHLWSDNEAHKIVIFIIIVGTTANYNVDI